MVVASLKFPLERVAELETELQEVRKAFDLYVSNTKGIEVELENELEEMRKKLASSTTANEALGNRLEQFQPMLKELEASLEANKSKLQEESKLRLQAETALVEARDQETSTGKSLRQENESLRKELKMYLNGNGEAEISGRSPPTCEGSSGGDSYKDILDELEGVTEKLIDTQQNLWIAEDKLRVSQSRVKMLESAAHQLKKEGKLPCGHRSLLDLTLNETFETASIADPNHIQEFRRVQNQLNVAREELRKAEVQAKRAQRQAKVAHDQAKTAGVSKSFSIVPGENSSEYELLDEELTKCQDELEEKKRENCRLKEEILCLQEILQDQTNRERAEAKSSSEQRAKELNVVRDRLKDMVRQNAALQEKVDRFERSAPASRDDEIVRLKKEIVTLKSRFERAGEENVSTMNDSVVEWHLRLEKLRAELDTEKQNALTRICDEMTNDKDIRVNALQARVDQLLDEKCDLSDKVECLLGDIQKSRKEKTKLVEQCRSATDNFTLAKDEILSLKKKNGILTNDLEHIKQKLVKVESEAESYRGRYASVCAELEVARQVLDDAGLEGETIAREDETELKRQIHSLSKSLEHTRQEYAELENDFLDSQHRFCDSQEEAHRKTSDEIHYLKGKIAEMEAALEAGRAEYSELSGKLEHAKKESLQSIKKGEKQGRENVIQALKVKKSTALQENNDAVDDSNMGDLHLQLGELMAQVEKINEELHDCKTELECSKKENITLKLAISNQTKPVFETNVFSDDVSPMDALGNEYSSDDVGLEVVLTTSKERNILNPLSWFARDTQSAKSEVGIAISRSDSHEMHSQLHDLTRENDFLKKKVSHLLAAGRTSKPESLTREIKQVIGELEEALRAQDRASDELERTSQKLAKTEKKLAVTKTNLVVSDEENENLKSHVQELKGVVADLLQNLRDAQGSFESTKSRAEFIEDAEDDFHELRDQLTARTAEKAALQHELDDSKIALSVAQYAHERNKEELKLCEANLQASSDEVFNLRDELDSMSRSLSDMKRAYDDVVNALKEARTGEEDARMAASTLSKKLSQLSTEYTNRQSTITELESALILAHNEISKKSKELSSLSEKHYAKQEEANILTGEISHLTTIVEASKAEYNLVVEELETVCELFEDARREAEKDGRETAIREIQLKMKSSREKERETMREEAKKIFQEAGSLQQKLVGVENALAQARSEDEISAMSREIKILKFALKTSDEEVKRLKEREINLSLALKESKNDLSQSKDELQLLNQSMDDSRRAAERTARQSAAEAYRSIDNSVELVEVRNKLKILLENRDEVAMGADSADPDGGHRAEGLRLKMELIDMSMSLEKIMKENSIIEEELEHMRYATEQARKEGEKEGVMKATSKLRQEMREQREGEMKEMSQKFYQLAEENASLSLQLRDADVRFELAINSKGKGQDDVATLQNDLEIAKAETLKFQQAVFDLSSELKAAREDQQRTDSELATSASDESDAKTKDLQTKLYTFTLENTKLLNKLKNAEFELRNAKSSEERGQREMESLSASLQESKATIEDLEAQVSKLSGEVQDIMCIKEELSSEKAIMEKKLKIAEAALVQAKSSTLGEIHDLNQALKASKEENSTLKSLTTQLKRTLKESTKELDKLREQFDRVCSNVATRDKNEANALRIQLNKLAEEKSALQKQVDESELSHSLRKYTDDRNTRSDNANLEVNQPANEEGGNEETQKASLERIKPLLSKEPTDEIPGTSISASERDADFHLLQDQFKKLTQKSETLGKKVEEAENVVKNIRSMQESTRGEAELRKKQTCHIQSQIEKAIEENQQKDQSMIELSRMMGSRVSMVEENVNRLEKDISLAKGKLEVTEAGLVILRKLSQGRKPTSSSSMTEQDKTASEQRDSTNNDEDSSISSTYSAETITQVESREDTERSKRDEPPEIQPSASKDSVNLTTRALEAVATSRKKNTLRKLDLRAAQRKVFGVAGSLTAETGKEEVSARD